MTIHSTQVFKQYKFRLYRCDKKDRKLRHMIFVASTIWNHFVALQRRYYALTGKYISLDRMNRHVLKLRRLKRFELWQGLHSQACQDVCLRVDDGYQRFFKGLAKGRPKFRKARKYASFTFPQSGYQVKGRQVRIGGVRYGFVKHREIGGQIKALTVKRDSVGRLWLVFRVLETMAVVEASTGKSGGFDFGLKTFLVNDEGDAYTSPQFFAQGMDKTRRLHRELARKVEGLAHHRRARRALAKHRADVANKRRDHHFKLAHALCDAYAVLYFEDLNLLGMKALWGRKVSDLGFGRFMSILDWVVFKRGVTLVKIGRWERTTAKCSGCGHKQAMALRDRVFVCACCGLALDRDHNAAINIKAIGASMVNPGDGKTKVRLRSSRRR